MVVNVPKKDFGTSTGCSDGGWYRKHSIVYASIWKLLSLTFLIIFIFVSRYHPSLVLRQTSSDDLVVVITLPFSDQRTCVPSLQQTYFKKENTTTTTWIAHDWINTTLQIQAMIKREGMTTSLWMALHLMNTSASFALGLPGKPSKQPAVGGSSANNAWNSWHHIVRVVQIAVEFWQTSIFQTGEQFETSTSWRSTVRTKRKGVCGKENFAMRRSILTAVAIDKYNAPTNAPKLSEVWT